MIEMKPAPRKKYFTRFDFYIALVVIIGMLGGVAILATRNHTISWRGVSLTLPASLQGRVSEGKSAVVLQAPFSRSPYFIDRIRLVRVLVPTVASNSVDPVHTWRREQYGRYRMYREIDGGNNTVQGKNWVQFEYAYVVDPDTGSPGQDARPPVVVQGIARMYRKEGGRSLFVLSYDCDSLDYRENLSRAVAVFDSLQHSQ